MMVVAVFLCMRGTDLCDVAYCVRGVSLESCWRMPATWQRGGKEKGAGREQGKAAGTQQVQKPISILQHCCGSLFERPVLYLFHGLIKSP